MPRTYTITGENPSAYYNPRTRTINVDPSFRPTVQTSEGPRSAATEIILGHELGHAATRARDDGPGNMNNVIQNENPIRIELGYPPRTRY